MYTVLKNMLLQVKLILDFIILGLHANGKMDSFSRTVFIEQDITT
jgi:hypothetical protein